MQTIRDAANAVMQGQRNRRSIRARVASGELAYDALKASEWPRFASPSTVRKWRRTHEAREAGWLK